MYGTIGVMTARYPDIHVPEWQGRRLRGFFAAGPEERRALLDRVLTGNLLSMAKGLGATVEGRLVVESRLTPRPVAFKGGTVLGFTGEFSVNYVIPDLLGLGKSVSRGFGAVGWTAG